MDGDALGGHVAPGIALDVPGIDEELEGAVAEIADGAEVGGLGVFVAVGIEKAGELGADEFGGVGEKFGETFAEPIVEALGICNFGEAQIGVVVALHVGAGAAYEDVLQDAVADFGGEMGEGFVALVGGDRGVAEQVVVAALYLGKEVFEVAAFGFGEGGGGAVAGEEIDLVAQVLRTVVLRRGREQADVGAEAVAGGDVADEGVELPIAPRVVVAQAMALVDEQQAVVGRGQGGGERNEGGGFGTVGRFVVLLTVELEAGGACVELVVGWIVVLVGKVEKVEVFVGGLVVALGNFGEGLAEQLTDAPGSGEVDVGTDGGVGVGIEARHGFAPRAEHGGGRDDENAARTTGGFGAVDQKVLGEEYGDDGFPQTDHVGEEKTTVLVEDVTALFDGIELIVEGGEVLGEIAGEGVAEVLVEDVAKLVDEGFDVKLVGRERGGGLLGTPAAGGGPHHFFEKLLRPGFGVRPLVAKPREVAVETRTFAGHCGDEGGVAFEVIEFGIAFESFAREVGTADDAARVGLPGEDVALGVEKLLVAFGVSAAVEVDVDALVGTVGEEKGEGAHVLLGDFEVGEVGADEVVGVGGTFVLGFFHHRGIDVGVFADEKLDVGAFAL